MKEKSVDELVFELSDKSGKSTDEVKQLIEAKIQKFSGLLTEQGAAYMVQKELGVKGEGSVGELAKVKELVEGMKGAEIKGTVQAVFPTKEFEKNQKKGKLKSFILGDDTGEVRVTLWNDQVDKYDITKGSEIEVSNAVVTKYNEKTQVALGFNGSIKILNKKEEPFDKIANLKGGVGSVNVVGRLVRKFPCKEFATADRKGKLCSFQFGDETALLRATAWNEKADEVMHYNEGDVVEIKNAYTKDGKFGVELHLGYSAQIATSQKAVPSIMEIIKESVVEKKINGLVDGENVLINAKMVEIMPGNLHYLVCEKCGKKLTKSENGMLCDTCGEVKGRKNAVVSARIEDDTGEVRASFFGKNALMILGWDEERLEKELSDKSTEKIISEINDTIKGKIVKAYGYQRTNNFSQQNEFMVKEVLA